MFFLLCSDHQQGALQTPHGVGRRDRSFFSSCHRLDQHPIGGLRWVARLTLILLVRSGPGRGKFPFQSLSASGPEWVKTLRQNLGVRVYVKI